MVFISCSIAVNKLINLFVFPLHFIYGRIYEFALSYLMCFSFLSFSVVHFNLSAVFECVCVDVKWNFDGLIWICDFQNLYFRLNKRNVTKKMAQTVFHQTRVENLIFIYVHLLTMFFSVQRSSGHLALSASTTLVVVDRDGPIPIHYYAYIHI